MVNQIYILSKKIDGMPKLRIGEKYYVVAEDDTNVSFIRNKTSKTDDIITIAKADFLSATMCKGENKSEMFSEIVSNINKKLVEVPVVDIPKVEKKEEVKVETPAEVKTDAVETPVETKPAEDTKVEEVKAETPIEAPAEDLKVVKATKKIKKDKE